MNNTLRIVFAASFLVFNACVIWFDIMHGETSHKVSLEWAYWSSIAIGASIGVVTVTDAFAGFLSRK